MFCILNFVSVLNVRAQEFKGGIMLSCMINHHLVPLSGNLSRGLLDNVMYLLNNWGPHEICKFKGRNFNQY